MKKTLIVLAAFMAASTLYAQTDHTFEFVDASGNIVSDGSVITVNTTEDDGFGDIQMPVPLAVKATADTDNGGTIRVDASAMPNGSFQICSFGNCIAKSEACVFLSAKGKLNNATKESIAAEWLPLAEGTWTATLQLQVVEPEYDDMSEEYVYDKVVGDGPKVTVVFQYGNGTGISTPLSSHLSHPVAYYSLSGQRLSGTQQGITIVRTEDGRSYKVKK